MKEIICKKCGNTIDASKGECPVCGAVYYIISESETEDLSGTRVWDTNNDTGNDEYESVNAHVNENKFSRQQEMPPRRQQPPAQRPSEQGQTRQPPQEGQFRPVGQQRPPAQRPPQQNQSGQPRQNGQPRQGGQQRPPQQRFDGMREQNTMPQQRPAGQRQGQPQQRQAGAPRQRQAIDPRQAYYEEGYDSQGKQKRGIDRRIFIVGAFVLLALLAVIVLVNSFSGKNDTLMPDVVGMTSMKAEKTLTDLNLEVTIENKYSEEPEGIVIDQSIKEGNKVSQNDMVILGVSKGLKEEDEEDKKTEVPAPYLGNKTLAEARQAVQALGLTLVQLAEEYSDSVPAGQIISQTPNSGAVLYEGDPISVVVSKGIEPTPTPTAYSVSVTVGKGGTVSPKGQVSVNDGDSVTFTITPDSEYELRELKIDGVDVGVQSTYTFTNVKGNHTLYAVFQVKVEPTPSPTPTPTPPPTPTPTPPEAEIPPAR